MSLTGDADGKPYRGGAAMFDVHEPGCTRRSRSSPRCGTATRPGEGQLLEINLLSTAMSCLVNQTEAYVAARYRAAADGQRAPERVPVRADADGSDGELIVIAANDGQFRKLARCSATRDGRGPALRRTRRAGNREP